MLDDRFSGIQIEQLSRARGEMSVQLYRAQPGASSEGSYTHTGKEFIFLLRGGYRPPAGAQGGPTARGGPGGIAWA